MTKHAMNVGTIYWVLGAWIADFRALCSLTFELPLPNVKLARSRAYPLIHGESNKGRRGSQLDAWLSEGQVRIPVPHLLWIRRLDYTTQARDGEIAYHRETNSRRWDRSAARSQTSRHDRRPEQRVH